MGLPPWEESSSQLFTLITGANTGLGYAICQRLIDEFLTSSGPNSTSHLILILTTRTPEKTQTTISKLRKHLRKFAETSSTAKAWTQECEKAREEDGGWSKPYNYRNTIARVHFFGLEVDLCDLKGVKRIGKILVDGEVRLGQGVDGEGEGYRIPRLDNVIMNAGIGGWIGVNWGKAIWSVMTDLVHATTWPEYKIADVGKRVRKQVEFEGKRDIEEKETVKEGNGEPVLGEVFTANVFGHYMLGHYLMPLLRRPPRPLTPKPDLTHSTISLASESSTSNSNVNTPTSSNSDFASNPNSAETEEPSRANSPGRIIWISSVEAIASTFSLSDIQGLESAVPYESSKRLTDILALTANLPFVEKTSRSYFSCNDNEEQGQPPNMYLTHPGICATEIIPLPWILVQAMNLAMYMARWLGSIWHLVSPYGGACAMVWISLMSDSILSSMGENPGEGKAKWGSSTDWWGNARVRRTEVEGWGWDGKKGGGSGFKEVWKGRRRGVRDTGVEEREAFEVVGREVWGEMEKMRGVWESWLEGEGV